jgi:MOSC domain-containing protein YiiM
VGDAHAGAGDRQVSLLAAESVERMKEALLKGAAGSQPHRCPKGGDMLGPGAFAENLTTRGLDLWALPVGTCLRVGPEAMLEISRIGKECHRHCEVYRRLGDCVMPREGVFARVLRGGVVSAGDEVRIEKRCDSDGQ